MPTVFLFFLRSQRNRISLPPGSTPPNILRKSQPRASLILPGNITVSPDQLTQPERVDQSQASNTPFSKVAYVPVQQRRTMISFLEAEIELSPAQLLENAHKEEKSDVDPMKYPRIRAKFIKERCLGCTAPAGSSKDE